GRVALVPTAWRSADVGNGQHRWPSRVALRSRCRGRDRDWPPRRLTGGTLLGQPARAALMLAAVCGSKPFGELMTIWPLNRVALIVGAASTLPNMTIATCFW